MFEDKSKVLCMLNNRKGREVLQWLNFSALREKKTDMGGSSDINIHKCNTADLLRLNMLCT